MRKLNQKGSLIVFLTLGMALLGTFIGFAVDFGRAYLEKARVSRLIDGAALAAAKSLKGQVGFEADATRAACDSMLMNGAQVSMTSPTTCSTVAGAPLTATVSFFDFPVPGGPPLRHVRVIGNEPVPTTFLRFLGWMAPGDYSKIDVVAQAEAGPERPIDLMLVLDRSGSMTSTDGSGITKIAQLKTAVNGFLGLSNTFSADDRIGITSFASRGCGVGGGDTTASNCTPDQALDFATSGHIATLQSAVNALVASGGTNTMEAIRTARGPLANAFNDPTRATTRKAMLLVTDGQPTFMKLDNDNGCKRHPITGANLPGNGSGNGGGGPFNSGCKLGVPTFTSTNSNPWIYRERLSSTNCLVKIPGSWSSTGCPGSTTQTTSDDAQLYKDVIRCTRSLTGCVVNGAMYEANQVRNCGYGNSACNTGGEHDIVFFAIAIGQDTSSVSPQQSMDANAKCMLARMANATDILHAATGVVETMASMCNNVFTTTVDGDTHADLVQAWPCGTGPCIDSTQEKGKVYIVDPTGNVAQQLNLIFREIAAILKLRLVL